MFEQRLGGDVVGVIGMNLTNFSDFCIKRSSYSWDLVTNCNWAYNPTHNHSFHPILSRVISKVATKSPELPSDLGNPIP